jgi:hypothetical protein
MRRIKPITAAWACVGLLALLAAAGCQLLAWGITAFSPPQKIPAAYKPPANKRVLVFVDDLDQPADHQPIKAQLTRQLNDQLVANGVAASTVPYEDLLSLAAVSPNFNEMRVTDVGRELNADLVLYVKLDQFTLKEFPDSPLWHGKLSSTIRWVDVAAAVTGEGPLTLWPQDRPVGQPMGPIETRPVENTSQSYGSEVCRELASQAADTIAKKFYDHRAEDNYKAQDPNKIFQDQ